MKRIKRSVIRVLLALLIAGFVPAAAFSQFNETSGLMFTPTAGTIPEGSWRAEGYSGFYLGQVLSVSIGTVIDSFISTMGASLMYGLSRNTEMSLNVQSFDNIISGSSINLPEIHLNCKVNLLPTYGSTGLGFVVQLVNFSGSEIEFATDLFITGTTIIKEAVGLSMQLGLRRYDHRFAIYTSPRSNTNLLLEVRYLPGTPSQDASLVLFPGVKFGSSEEGLQLKLCTMLDLTGVLVDELVLFIKAGFSF